MLVSNHIMPLSCFRSFAVAVRLVLRCGSDCPVPRDLPRLLDCLGSSVARFFSIKAFQWIRCPAVLPVAVSWRLCFPSSRSSSLAASPASLADALPALLSRRLRCRRSARHLIAAISSRPVPRLAPLCCLLGSSALPHPSSRSSSRAICLLAALRPASPSRSSPRSPLVDVITVLSDRFRAVRLTVIDRPALLVAWLGAGRDGEPLSPSPARLAAAACPVWRLACVCFLVAVCLLACRRLCRYYGGEIVYMICPVVII